MFVLFAVRVDSKSIREPEYRNPARFCMKNFHPCVAYILADFLSRLDAINGRLSYSALTFMGHIFIKR